MKFLLTLVLAFFTNPVTSETLLTLEGTPPQVAMADRELNVFRRAVSETLECAPCTIIVESQRLEQAVDGTKVDSLSVSVKVRSCLVDGQPLVEVAKQATSNGQDGVAKGIVKQCQDLLVGEGMDEMERKGKGGTVGSGIVIMILERTLEEQALLLGGGTKPVFKGILMRLQESGEGMFDRIMIPV